MSSALLPSGFYDVLAPDAARLNAAVAALLKSFAAYGYAQVAPPLLEFEETLLAGPGSALARGTFRVMDGLSKRMLGIRGDHTLQVARIAATRLSAASRPLRLSYAGPVVRLQGEEQEPARQLCQVGAELIGTIAPEADAEVLLLALSSLNDLGLKDIGVDILLPTLIPSICAGEKIAPKDLEALQHALTHKDETAVKKLAQAGVKAANLALELMRASGPAKQALVALEKMPLAGDAAADRARLKAFLGCLPAALANEITVDLVEYRGFEYQTGLSFSLFSKKARAEVGRGGRYRTSAGEAATGFTFYAEALVQVLPPAENQPRLMVPFGLSREDAQKLISQGYALVQGWKEGDKAFDLTEAAKAQACTHAFKDGKIVKI
jgi:ATP phosphoribosyltransferase regulatory subunit